MRLLFGLGRGRWTCSVEADELTGWLVGWVGAGRG